MSGWKVAVVDWSADVMLARILPILSTKYRQKVDTSCVQSASSCALLQYTLRRAPRGPDVARHSGQSLADLVSSGSLDAVMSCSTSGPVRPSVRLESRAPVATLKTTSQLLGLSGFV